MSVVNKGVLHTPFSPGVLILFFLFLCQFLLSAMKVTHPESIVPRVHGISTSNIALYIRFLILLQDKKQSRNNLGTRIIYHLWNLKFGFEPSLTAAKRSQTTFSLPVPHTISHVRPPHERPHCMFCQVSDPSIKSMFLLYRGPSSSLEYHHRSSFWALHNH